jgi:hypothetical protein
MLAAACAAAAAAAPAVAFDVAPAQQAAGLGATREKNSAHRLQIWAHQGGKTSAQNIETLNSEVK